jgi:hypothetical protein
VIELRDDRGELMRYITAGEASDYLGPDVTPAMVYKWRQRRMVNAYRVGREKYYRLDELKEVEGVLRRSARGRPRRSVG